MSLRFTPSYKVSFRRSLLYVPSHEPKKIQKISQFNNLDVVSLDLEDGVPSFFKEKARENILTFLKQKPAIHPELAVRINPLDSTEAMNDLKTIFLNENSVNIATLILSKVEHQDEIKFINRFLDLNSLNKMNVFALIESPLGFTNLNKIAKTKGHLDCLIFGSEDFKTRSGISGDLINFRNQLVCEAKSNQLDSFDMICLDYRNTKEIEKESRITKSLGFSGKQVIHPMQAEVVHQVYQPNAQEIEESEKIIKEFTISREKGKGVLGLDGKMIELPHIQLAFDILAKAGKSLDNFEKLK